MSDTLKKYLFEDRSVRLQAVSLDSSWQAVLAHHALTPAVARLLGELVAASTLLAANLKFEGSLVLQLQGDGPIALIVVECRADLSLRATVKLRQGQSVPADGTLQSLLNAGGNGRFIVVLDPRRESRSQQPYQGVVPLEGDSVAEVLEHYMQASEQLDTRMWLAADGQRAAGVLLQRLPGHGGDAPTGSSEPGQDTWTRAGHLAATLTPGELLAADTDTLVHRLYWQETLIAFEPQTVTWHCPCTRERVGEMLHMLGRPEVESILQEQGRVEVVCDFCGKPYQFDAVDCAALFAQPGSPGTPGGNPTLH